ncbi:hypothetical protein SDC9_99971 [bioreactor metagenome]|uniref:Uncharacterized protein n=1 Tax=bioreactor metagenome TaxID=1076179 RepID=A0A645AJU9_9ZZZZ
MAACRTADRRNGGSYTVFNVTRSTLVSPMDLRASVPRRGGPPLWRRRQRVLGPRVLGVAAAVLGPHLWVGVHPERREVVGDRQRSPGRGEQVQQHRHPARTDPWRTGQAEALLQLHRQHRTAARIVDLGVVDAEAGAGRHLEPFGGQLVESTGQRPRQQPAQGAGQVEPIGRGAGDQRVDLRHQPVLPAVEQRRLVHRRPRFPVHPVQQRQPPSQRAPVLGPAEHPLAAGQAQSAVRQRDPHRLPGRVG